MRKLSLLILHVVKRKYAAPPTQWWLTFISVVLAVTKEDVGAPVTKFRTHNISDDFQDCKIWEVARATSAATTFFPSISVGQQRIEFIDAGFGHNNPSEVLISEAEDIFSGEPCDCVLSIGTGLTGVISIKDSRLAILEALKKMASNSSAVHHRLAKRLPEDLYFRFDVTRGLEDITLSDWEKSSKISAHTKNYLEEIHVERAIKNCARILSGVQG
jgi:patatin-like phospholipase/acyl hydrolase